jgi:DNA polymerase-3 subunit alpha
MFDLFADVDGVDDMAAIPDPDPSDEWDRHMKLAQEKDVLGIYVSDHPLRPYEYALAKARSFSINELLNGYEVVDPDGTAHIEQVPADRNVWIAGMVSGVRPITTKQGKKMATVTLEDMESEVAVVVFPKVYEKAEALLRGDTNEGGEPGDIFVRILGKLERGDRGDQLMAQEIEPLLLNDAANKPKSLEVHVPARFVTQSAMESMQRSLRRYPGLDRMNVYVEAQDGTLLHLEVPNKVDARNVVLFAELQSLVGDTGHVRLID